MPPRLLVFSHLLCLSVLVSCLHDPYDLDTLQLEPFGIPVSILAPDSAIVRVKPYDNVRDITIRKGWYDLQVFEFSPSMNDPEMEKRNQLLTVRDSPGFRQVLLDDEQGFIFSSQPDSATTRYDFRYIKLVGDKELIFQTGVTGTYSLDDVKRMYEAVQ